MGHLDVRPLEAPFGIEIHEFDPHADLDDDTARRLRALFDDHGLIVFRDIALDFGAQQSLVDLLMNNEPSLVDGTTSTGEVVAEFHVTNEAEGAYVGTGRLLFHSDAMWSTDPFELISLYGVHVDREATPTVYANTARAWATLPDELRGRVEGLHATHGEGEQAGDGKHHASHPGQLERSCTTPVGMQHPRTDRTLLYVSEQQTREVVELAPAESDGLLAELFAHLYAPANTLEHHWREGDLVAWDNLTVQHSRADVELHGPARTLRKAVVPPPWLWAVEYAM